MVPSGKDQNFSDYCGPYAFKRNINEIKLHFTLVNTIFFSWCLKINIKIYSFIAKNCFWKFFSYICHKTIKSKLQCSVVTTMLIYCLLHSYSTINTDHLSSIFSTDSWRRQYYHINDQIQGVPENMFHNHKHDVVMEHIYRDTPYKTLSTERFGR